MLRQLKRWFFNQMALREVLVRVWLDDLRPAPRGWYHALTAAEAQTVLSSCYVTDISLDHDLGEKETGYDLVLWLVRMREESGINFWPVNKPRIHSQNPIGRENMKAMIDRYGPYGDNLIKENDNGN